MARDIDTAGHEVGSVKEMFNLIGRTRVEARLGLSYKSLQRAMTDNKCPSSWFLMLREELISLGSTAPFSLFSFIRTEPLSEDFGRDGD